MRKLNFSFKSLLLAAGLLIGSANAWATVYNGTTANYEVLFGSPTYTDEVITGVTPATEFATDNSEQSFTTMTLTITGSCLAGNQDGGRTYSFTNAPTTGKVYFKANGKFVGGNYNFFSIVGSVTDSEETENPSYNIVQSPYALPKNTGETTVLRIFGQNITANVYTPRDVVYGFDVTIDMVNQKVDYSVTYASNGSNGAVTALSTVSGSVAVPDGYTLNSVSSWSLPSSYNHYYDNVAFYSEVPTATLYTATFTETNSLSPTITIYSNSEMTEEVTNGYLTDGTYYYKAVLTGYYDKTGSFTVSGSAPSVSFTMEVIPVYSYTVNAVDGSSNVLKRLASGSAYKDATIYYHYNNVLNVNGTLYTAAADNSAYKSNFTLDADSKVATKVYSQPATPITNLVFLAEGEDIFTRGTGSNADTRCSMGAGGYASEKTAFVTLPAGTYHLCGVNRGGDNGTKYHKFYLGSAADPFFQTTGAGYNVSFDSGEFTLDETTVIYMQGGDNNKYVDWLYIYGTPTNEIVGAIDKSAASADNVFGSDIILKKGEVKKITFKNHGSNGGYGNNWMLKYSYAGAEVTTIRADWWWKDGKEHKGAYTDAYTHKEAGDVWANWYSDMDNSTVELTVSNADGIFSVNGTMVGAADEYYFKYAYDNSFDGDITLNLSVNLSWLEITSVEKVLTSSANLQGYKTFYDATSNYEVDENTTIYYVNGNPGSGATEITLTSVEGNIVPKETPVLLKTNNTTDYTITLTPTADDSEDDFSTNALTYTAEGGTVSNAYVFGYLSAENDGDGLAFYKYEADLPAGSIYVNIPSSVKALRIVVDGEATGITEMSDGGSLKAESDVLYNLNGQQVTADFKGIVIKNGKKYFNK